MSTSFIKTSILWIFINSIFPLMPIAFYFFIYKLSDKDNQKKWYQILSKDNGLSIYSAILSATSIAAAIKKEIIYSSLFSLLTFIALGLIFMMSTMLYGSLAFKNLYFNQDTLNESNFDEKLLSVGGLSLAIGAVVLGFIMACISDSL